MRTALIGTGMQGSRYAAMIASGKVKGMEQAAMTRFREQYRELLKTAIEKLRRSFRARMNCLKRLRAGEISLHKARKAETV